MKFFRKDKDGGPTSTVTGYWLFEIKRLFSVALLKFEHGSRDEYHSHAFNSISWLLKGELLEQSLYCWKKKHFPSFFPIITTRSNFHRVYSNGTTWVLTFRGPWAKQWQEYDPGTKTYTTLEHGRVVANTIKVEMRQ